MIKKIKRMLSLFLSVVLLISGLYTIEINSLAATSGTCGDSAIWNYDATTTTLTISGTGAIKDYNAMLSRVPWRDYKQEITTIVVEEGITEIGEYNFYNCGVLTSVSLPSTLKVIAGTGTMEASYGAFQACVALESINLPQNLETIETCAFKGCTALKSVTIPDSVTTLGYGAFCDCTALTTVTFGDGLTETGLNTFYNDTGLKRIYWGNSITKVTSYSFFRFGGTEIEFPEQITEIGYRSFADNNYLRKVTINNPDCVISTMQNSDIVSPFAGHEQDFVTIYGHKGSTAENFAATFEYPFVSIDSCDHTETNDVVTVEPTCTEEGVTSTICASCGQVVKTAKIDALGHTYEVIETVDQTDFDGHVYITERCSVCSDVRDVITHQKLENGDTNYIWIDGYYTYTNNATCTRPGVEQYTCNVEGCGQIETHVATSSHTVNTWTITKAPTCTEDGERQGVCEICGETVTEAVAKTNHYYNENDLMESIDATEDDGHIHHIYICENCGEQLDEPEHINWTEGFYTAEIISEPHCVISGLEVDTCSVCGTIRNVTLESNGGHDWYETSRTEPTCTAVGKIFYACRNCNMTKSDNIAELGHDYVMVEESSKAATCTEPGYNYLKCNRCSATMQETLPKTGHVVDTHAYTVISEPTCEEDGLIVSMCAVCDTQFEQTVPALGHDFVDVKVDLTSENKPGHSLVTPTCTRCGTTQTSSMSHDEWLDEYTKQLSGGVPATCEVSGYTRQQCTICGSIGRIPIPAIGHKYYYTGSNNTEDLMIYDCSTCRVSTHLANPYDIYAMWNKSYANTVPNRTLVDNSSLLDLNGDNIINGKDFAMILVAKNTYQRKIDNYQRIKIEFDNMTFIAALYDKTASSNLVALCPLENALFAKDGGCYVSSDSYKFTGLPTAVSEIKAGEIYVDTNNFIRIAYCNATFEEAAMMTKIGYIENVENLDKGETATHFNISVVEKNVE